MHTKHLHTTHTVEVGKWIIYPTQLKGSLTGEQGLTLPLQEYSNEFHF